MRNHLQLKDRTKDLIIAIVAIVLLIVIFLSRYNYVLVSHPWLLAACDALFSVGMIYILWGVLLYAAYKGGMDPFLYAARVIVNLFKKGKNTVVTDYYEFTQTRKRPPNRFKTFLLLGGIMLAFSLVFFALYWKTR